MRQQHDKLKPSHFTGWGKDDSVHVKLHLGPGMQENGALRVHGERSSWEAACVGLQEGTRMCGARVLKVPLQDRIAWQW